MLIVVPWSTFWDRNVFAEAVPWLHAVLQNDFVRGAVSGVGLVNLGAGCLELAAWLGTARRRPDLCDRISVGVADGPDG